MNGQTFRNYIYMRKIKTQFQRLRACERNGSDFGLILRYLIASLGLADWPVDLALAQLVLSLLTCWTTALGLLCLHSCRTIV